MKALKAFSSDLQFFPVASCFDRIWLFSRYSFPSNLRPKFDRKTKDGETFWACLRYLLGAPNALVPWPIPEQNPWGGNQVGKDHVTGCNLDQETKPSCGIFGAYGILWIQVAIFSTAQVGSVRAWFLRMVCSTDRRGGRGKFVGWWIGSQWHGPCSQAENTVGISWEIILESEVDKAFVCFKILVNDNPSFSMVQRLVVWLWSDELHDTQLDSEIVLCSISQQCFSWFEMSCFQYKAV